MSRADSEFNYEKRVKAEVRQVMRWAVEARPTQTSLNTAIAKALAMPGPACISKRCRHGLSAYARGWRDAAIEPKVEAAYRLKANPAIAWFPARHDLAPTFETVAWLNENDHEARFRLYDSGELELAIRWIDGAGVPGALYFDKEVTT